MRKMRHYEPVRWAARRLAVLSVQAQPDHGEAGNENWRELQRLLSAGQGFDHTHGRIGFWVVDLHGGHWDCRAS
jgi:hypothetical protein